jgi:tetratricopeptide (TPR) repeat protein
MSLVPIRDELPVTDVTERRSERRATEARINQMASGSAMRVAIGHLVARRLADAEAAARQRLAERPDDVTAICLLGDLAARAGIHNVAEQLFRRALFYAPLFTDAQINLARILALRDGVPEAITLLTEVVTDQPERWAVALERLTLMGQIGDYDRAAADYDKLLELEPNRAEIWCGFGHLQKTRGDALRSVDAFHRAIALDESYGEAWWGLANLKIYHFDDIEVGRLERLANTADIAPTARSAIKFALGRALEDRRDFPSSFRHYVDGNALRRRQANYDATATSAETMRSIAFFTSDILERGQDAGHPTSDPIFILGLPRSGSTLVEQILSSHSQVEGTAELPYIPMLVHRLLAERWQERSLTFPAVLQGVSTERLRELGRTYLDAAAIHRREGTPFFIDKLPNNWTYIGFIRLILPKAKIIDARREPLACCLSNYKQWFARGQEFSYDLADLGCYYRDYLSMMDHMDHVQPGAVRRVIHEDLVSDPDNQIKSLLADLGLPFEQGCLEFHQNARPVRTASSEQVRRPINRDSLDLWRHYEPWLGDLKAALAG